MCCHKVSVPLEIWMDELRIMGFHQTPSTILIDDPIPKRPPPPPFHLMFIKIRVKDVEMITLKRLAQVIGKKKQNKTKQKKKQKQKQKNKQTNKQTTF